MNDIMRAVVELAMPVTVLTMVVWLRFTLWTQDREMRRWLKDREERRERYDIARHNELLSDIGRRPPNPGHPPTPPALPLTGSDVAERLPRIARSLGATVPVAVPSFDEVAK